MRETGQGGPSLRLNLLDFCLFVHAPRSRSRARTRNAACRSCCHSPTCGCTRARLGRTVATRSISQCKPTPLYHSDNDLPPVVDLASSPVVLAFLGLPFPRRVRALPDWLPPTALGSNPTRRCGALCLPPGRRATTPSSCTTAWTPAHRCCRHDSRATLSQELCCGIAIAYSIRAAAAPVCGILSHPYAPCPHHYHGCAGVLHGARYSILIHGAALRAVCDGQGERELAGSQYATQGLCLLWQVAEPPTLPSAPNRRRIALGVIQDSIHQTGLLLPLPCRRPVPNRAGQPHGPPRCWDVWTAVQTTTTAWPSASPTAPASIMAIRLASATSGALLTSSQTTARLWTAAPRVSP